MSITYDAFKTFIITHLWKMGDSVVVDNLDTLIKMADSALSRDLNVQQREHLAKATATDTLVEFPCNCTQVRNIFVPSVGENEFEYCAPSDFNRIDVRNTSKTVLPYYTTVGCFIRLTGDISVTNPLEVQITYYAALPDFMDCGSSWVADNYLDLYVYSVLKHTAPFLREDGRTVMWSQLAAEALQSALDENIDRKYAGSPLRMKFSHIA